MNHQWPGRLRAYSAGSAPRPDLFPETRGVHPLALRTLADAKIPATDLHSKSWDQFIAQKDRLHFVFTLCDSAQTDMAEACPIFPGQPLTAHWGVQDPAVARGTEEEIQAVFREVFQIIQNRISLFGNLPIETLAEFSLRQRIEEIGRA